jgi:transposase-like protein
MTDITGENALALSAHDESYDPIEDRLRAMVRRTIEMMFEEALGRARYGRGGKASGYRNGHRDRQLVGTFGTETVRVPRGRVEDADGKVREWRSKALPRYRRLTKSEADQKTAWGAVFPTNEALIASVYLSGTNTRRVKRALSALFEGGKRQLGLTGPSA